MPLSSRLGLCTLRRNPHSNRCCKRTPLSHRPALQPPASRPPCPPCPFPASGHFVILVSSGAIGVGCQRLGLTARPTKIAQKQALAAVGQVHLMRYYEDFFSALGLVREEGGGVPRAVAGPRA